MLLEDPCSLKQAYAASKMTAIGHPYFARMESALGAATVAISRAGASSLAELAAMRVPSILVPFPAATDNHQWHNARAFEETGAAHLLEQKTATPESLADLILGLVESASARENMQNSLAEWHSPEAAERIAQSILEAIAISNPNPAFGVRPLGCSTEKDTLNGGHQPLQASLS